MHIGFWSGSQKGRYIDVGKRIILRRILEESVEVLKVT
jgi:hypothetical protein